MASNTIANLSVKLLANASGFASTIAGATKPLASFAGEVASTSLKIGGMMSALTGVVAGGSIAALVHSSMEAIDANAKLSDRLGIATDKLVGLQYAGDLAGVSNELLTGSLEKMLKTLGGVADDGTDASNVFTKLGLDAAKLANMPTDQAFAVIADKLSKITNASERATLAQQIFGKSGQQLLPLMMSGAEGIAAAQAEAEKLGLTYTRTQAAQVEAANDSITRMKSVVTGVGNQIAIGLAPYIDAAAAKLTSFATQGGGIGPKVGGAIEWVATGVATVTDYLNLANAGFKLLQAGGTAAVFGLVWVVDKLAHGVAYVSDLLGKKVDTTFLDQLTDGLQQDVSRLTDEARKAFDSFKNGDNAKAVAKVFADIRASSQNAAQGVADNVAQMNGAFKGLEDNSVNLKKVADTLTDLDKQVRQFGMTDVQKKLDDMKSLGASPDQLAQAQKSIDQLDALNAVKKRSEDLQSRTKSVLDSIATPTEKYDAQITNLNDLLSNGMITWEQYGRAVRKARSELEQPAEMPNVEAPELFKAGSAQAARMVYDLNRGSQKLTKDDVSKKQLASQEKSEDWLNRIERNTRSADATVVDV